MNLIQIITNNLADVMQRKDLILYMVSSHSKSLFFKSLIGQFWYFLENAFNILIYYFLLCIVYKSNASSELFFIIILGISHYSLFQSCINRTLKIFSTKESLLKQIYINPLVFFTVEFISSLKKSFYFILLTLLIIIIYKFSYDNILARLIIYILSFVTLSLITWSIALVCATYQVYFRDLEHLVPMVLRIMMYSLPILYPLERINSTSILYIVNLNPLTAVFHNIQAVFLKDTVPLGFLSLYSLFFSLLIFAGSFYIFNKKKNSIVKYL